MKRINGTAWIVRVLAVAALFGVAVWTIQQTGVITQIGGEDIYWERARFFLGHKGASLYTGSSLCSLGYSLILIPVCAIFHSPYAAYKAAILLNAVFQCFGYLAAAEAAKKLFPKEKESFLCAASFFAVFCPAYAFSRSYTGPQSAVLLLSWISVYLLVCLWEEKKRIYLISLAACMILLAFLQILTLGVVLAVVCVLVLYTKKNRIDENSLMIFILAVLVGVAAGNVAERVFLYAFAADMEITTIKSSLEVVLDAIGSFTDTNYLATLFNTLTGKLYSVLIGSFLLVSPALWEFCKRIAGRKKTNKSHSVDCTELSEKVPVYCVIGIFLVQFVWICMYDRTGSSGSSLLSLSGLEMVLSWMILIGIVSFKNAVKPEKELTGHLLLLCVVTFLTASVFQKDGTGNITGGYCGFFTIFRTNGSLMSATAAVYTAACLVLLIAILLCALMRALTGRKQLDIALRATGTAAMLVVFTVVGMRTVSLAFGSTSESFMQRIAPVASLVSGVDQETECVYFRGSGNDTAIAVLQSLLPEEEIQLIKNDEEERQFFFDELQEESENLLILTGPDESTISTYRENLEGYDVVYTTQYYALWARTDSTVYTELEEGVLARIETVSMTSKTTEEEETESESETETDSENEADLDSVDSDDEAGDGDETELLSEIQTDAESENELEPESETSLEDETDIKSGDENETEPESESGSETEGGTDKSKEKETLSSTVTFGGSLVLSAGTYKAAIKVHTDSDESMKCKVVVYAGSTKLNTASYTQKEFDENGDAYLYINFTSRDVMHSVKITLEGTMMTLAEAEEVIYHKTSSAYTIAINNTSSIRKAATIIKKTDKQCEVFGTVAYVDSLSEDAEDLSTEILEERLPDNKVIAITEEELAGVDTDYLIALTKEHSWYDAMDRYSIIWRGSTYTILVRNDSVQYKTRLEMGKVYSEGTEIDIRAFVSDDDVSEPIKLEMGDYIYHVRLQYNPELLTGEGTAVGAMVYLMNDDEVITSQEVTYEELLSRVDGIADVSVPLNMQSKAKKLTCVVEMTDDVDVRVIPQSIELVSEKYQFGKEEDLSELAALIENLEEGTVIYVVQKETLISNKNVQYTYLEEMLSEYEIKEISYSEAPYLSGDAVLLTYDLYSGITMKLLNSYTILGQAGQYTLWARSNGSYIQELTEAGAIALSSGTRISPECAAALAGVESTENAVTWLPKGQYRIYLKLTAQELELDDTVEVYLYRDKSEDAIESEIEELMDSGYARRETKKLVNSKKQCGSTSLQAYRLLETDDLIISITTSSSAIENLTCEVYTWHGGSVDAEILWIEMVS